MICTRVESMDDPSFEIGCINVDVPLVPEYHTRCPIIQRTPNAPVPHVAVHEDRARPDGVLKIRHSQYLSRESYTMLERCKSLKLSSRVTVVTVVRILSTWISLPVQQPGSFCSRSRSRWPSRWPSRSHAWVLHRHRCLPSNR